MSLAHSAIFATSLMLPVAAWAADVPALPPVVGDAIFKGVVGKALDAVPMDPGQRVVLQRGNAVVSSTLTGRSLAVWAGLTNPLLLIGGLVWGIFAASNIQANAATSSPDTTIAGPVACLDGAQEQVALLNDSPLDRQWPAASFKDQLRLQVKRIAD